MATRKNIIKMLEIVEKYDPDGYVCAEHDILFLISESEKMSPEDVELLKELGAHEEADGLAVFV
jgi:hypothetical protein